MVVRIVLIFLVTGLLFGAGLWGGYLFDDLQNLANNPNFAPSQLQQNFWGAVWSSKSSFLHRPITMLTFALQALVTGLDPFWFKLLNILLHALNATLVYALVLVVLRQINLRSNREWLFTPRNLALFVAAMWLAAPIQVSTVLYVIQRMELLSTLFVLLGLLLYVVGRQRQIEEERYGWVLIFLGLLPCTALAILSKENGALLPAFALLLEWGVFGFRQSSGRVDRKLLVLFLFVLVLPAVVGLIWLAPKFLSPSAYQTRSFDLQERLLTEGRVLLDYLRWIVLPTPGALSFYHDDFSVSTGWLNPVSTLLSWLGIGLMLVLAWVVRRKAPLISIGVLWYFLGHSMESTIIPLELVFEHRNYLPSVGVFLALASVGTLGADKIRQSVQRGIVALTLLLLAGYSAMTVHRAYVWGDSARLTHALAAKNPNSSRAVFAYARLLIANGKPGSAEYERGIKLLRLIYKRPDAGLLPVQALIVAQAQSGQPIDTAYWNHLMHLAKLRPLLPQDQSTLMLLVQCAGSDRCSMQTKDYQKLYDTLQAALHWRPDSPVLNYAEASFLYSVLGDKKEAIGVLRRAIGRNPDSLPLLNNLALLLIREGRLDDAAGVLDQMRRADRFGVFRAQRKELEKMLNAKRQIQ